MVQQIADVGKLIRPRAVQPGGLKSIGGHFVGLGIRPADMVIRGQRMNPSRLVDIAHHGVEGVNRQGLFQAAGALAFAAIFRGMWWWWGPPIVVLIIIFVSLFLMTIGLDEVANPRLRGLRR